MSGRCRICRERPCAPPVLEAVATTAAGNEVVRCHACGRFLEWTRRGPRETEAAMRARREHMARLVESDPTAGGEAA